MEHSRGLRIRDAQAEDLDEVASLLLAAYREYAPPQPSERWEWYMRNLTDLRGQLGHAELLVAEVDGRVLGTVMLYPDGSVEDAGGWPRGCAAVRRLGVHPEARGRGLGRALMEACVRRCRERGVGALGLHTTDAMAVARGLYERMGFARAPEMDYPLGSGAVLMAYRLEL